MYDKLKVAFDNLIKNAEFQELVKEFRFRFGIPEVGFSDTLSEEYKNWIKEALRKSDYLKEQFLFIAKRCRNLAPSKDPIPLVLLAYYFLYGKKPDLSTGQNDLIFSVSPSGILGSFDITFTAPLVFDLDEFLEEIDKHKDEIKQIAENAQLAIANLSSPEPPTANEIDPKLDLLATTPGSGAGIVDRVHRYITYLTEFGRVVLREDLNRMKDKDFVISRYEDKNKPISSPVQQMGSFLLNRGLYPIAEEYWKHIDNEIVRFNQVNKRSVNRGIPLGNQGVSQIAQGKVIEGLFNLYKAYQNDQSSLKHLKGVTIDPEKDLSQSILFTQFESRQIAQLFNIVVKKHSAVFQTSISQDDLKKYILGLVPDKKILLFVTLYRFAFSLELNKELSNPVNRGEILRSLSELALWYEDELKRKDTTLTGTLGNFMDKKVGQLNSKKGEYTSAADLDELETKIQKAISDGGDLSLVNARITTCVRNFTGHNIASHSHSIFSVSDEIMARMISLIMYSHSQGWI